jgi:hypothetical protein
MTHVERFSKPISEIVQEAEKALRISKFSPHEADTSQVPFFIASIEKEVTLQTLEMESTPEYRTEVNQLADKVNWSPLLRYIYLLLGSRDREFTYRGFTFLSLKKILDRQEEYTKAIQPRISDLALKYHGMGWVYLLALDTVTGKYFIRMDGGSSGWDRDANWKFYKNYDPLSRPDSLLEQDFIFQGETSEEIKVQEEKVIHS